MGTVALYPLWLGGGTDALLYFPAMLLPISFVQGAVQRAIQRKHAMGRCWFWGLLLSAWAVFFWFDLRYAQVQRVLLLVPCAMALGATVAAVMRLSTDHAAAACAIPAVALMWAIFTVRADNGRTGVSGVYSWTLTTTALLLWTFGPSVMASHLLAATSDRGLGERPRRAPAHPQWPGP